MVREMSAMLIKPLLQNYYDFLNLHILLFTASNDTKNSSTRGRETSAGRVA